MKKPLGPRSCPSEFHWAPGRPRPWHPQGVGLGREGVSVQFHGPPVIPAAPSLPAGSISGG